MLFAHLFAPYPNKNLQTPLGTLQVSFVLSIGWFHRMFSIILIGIHLCSGSFPFQYGEKSCTLDQTRNIRSA